MSILLDHDDVVVAFDTKVASWLHSGNRFDFDRKDDDQTNLGGT